MFKNETPLAGSEEPSCDIDVFVMSSDREKGIEEGAKDILGVGSKESLNDTGLASMSL